MPRIAPLRPRRRSYLLLFVALSLALTGAFGWLTFRSASAAIGSNLPFNPNRDGNRESSAMDSLGARLVNYSGLEKYFGSSPLLLQTAAPTLKADYQFQNTRTSSVGLPPALNDIGGVNSFSSETVNGSSHTILQFPQGSGLSLAPTTDVIPNDTYTIALYFRFNDVSGYRRILDFKNGTSDTGLYNLNGNLVFYTIVAGTSASIAPNTYVQVVLTRDASKNVVGYVNGVQQFSFVDTSDLALIDANNTLRFFKDNTSGGATSEDSAGAVARIRLYNGALTPSEVAALNECAPPPSGLVAWLSGDGNTNDISGNNNNGTPQGNVSYVAGKVAQAFSLNGTDASVKVPASASLNVGAGNGLTIDAWINPSDVSSLHPIVEWNNGVNFGTHLWFSVNSPSDLFTNIVDDLGNNHGLATNSGLIQANTYQHVALTYDKTSGNAVLYINGVVQASAYLGSFTPQTSYDMYLGLRPTDGTRYSGALDEVDIFNRALSQTEIQSIVTADSAGKCNVPPQPTFTLSGRVVDGQGAGVSGVTVSLYATQQPSTAVTTDPDGNYSFSNLSNDSYTVSPSQSGYFFTPSQRYVTINGSNAPGQDFVRAPNPSISGRIVDANNVGISGVTVRLNGQSEYSNSFVTGSDGSYSFTNLQPNQTYTIEPSKVDFYFTPPVRTYRNLNSQITNADFTGSPAITSPGKIAFISYNFNTGIQSIYLVDGHGRNRAIVPNTDGATEPHWSPDGTKLVFSRNSDGICTINTDGTGFTQLTNGPSDAQPSWSPSGAKIAFRRYAVFNEQGSDDIFVINADGTNPIRITNSSDTESSPTWSADSAKIAYEYSNYSGNGIGVINADGTNQTVLTTDGGFYPDWSPDGTKIAYSAYLNNYNSSGYAIIVMNADGSNPVNITQNYPGFLQNPSWSPDNARLATRGDQGIFAIKADGSERTRITNGNDALPAWQRLPAGAGGGGGTATTFTVTNTTDSGTGSLRQAIINANASTGTTDAISFNISGTGVQTINLLSALPAITDAVIIDGYTQPGASANTASTGTNAVLLIELNGSTASNQTAPGLSLNANSSTVRGLVINRFFGAGIHIGLNTTGNVIEGNFIGTNAAGTSALANAGAGVDVDGSVSNSIGGTSAAARNLISGNSGAVGVSITSATATVKGNLIGTDASGANALGNARGVSIQGTGANFNVVGGTESGAGNVIAFNTNRGVVVFNGNVGNAIESNSIFSNTGLGIDLGADNVTPNDGGDTDTGANNLQNYPVLTSASYSNNVITIQGTLNSTPNTTFRVEFFGNPTCDISGYGEGQFNRGAQNVTTDGSGNATINYQTTVLSGDGVITATATDPNGNTSEFSACQTVTTPLPTVDVQITKTDSPDPVTVGSNLTYTLQVTNGPAPSGTPDDTNVVVSDSLPTGVTFNSATATQGSCTQSNGTVTCSLGTLGFYSSATVTINVTPTAAGTITNTATVTSDNPDSNSANNSATATTTVQSAPIIVTNTNDSGTGSLREAILTSNASTGTKETIAFNIPVPSSSPPPSANTPRTITPLSALPTITDPVIIDGTTQPGYAGTPIIELNGTSAGGNGLTITAGNSTVRGLAINRFSLNGIQIQTNGGNTIAGCYIGTDTSGTSALANAQNGITIQTANNLIGGTTAGARNLVSGNGNRGVIINGAGATGNTVVGNYIGTNALGNGALPNVRHGVILSIASNNRVGGTEAGASNVISGNGQLGVGIFGDGTTAGIVVQGNVIGLAADGSAALGNGASGIQMSDTVGALIGGASPAARNIISANGRGIALFTSPNITTSGNLVQGNFIGTDASGEASRSNNGDGIALNSISGVTVGGSGAAFGNRIAFNSGTGVSIGSLILANPDGTTTTSPPGNNNNIQFNSIFSNSGSGVLVEGTGNAVRANSMFSNGGLGIDLSPTGVTPNDTGDADTGANNLQNYPLLTSVTYSGGNATAQGTLNSAASTAYNLEFFSNPICDPSGNGEGQTFVGSQSVTTDASGNATFSVNLANAPAGQPITATATDPNGNTSEFSTCRSTAVQTYTISGIVFDSSTASTLARATITLSGSQSGTVTTGQDGAFSFTVNAGGNYTVTPSKAGYTFDPPSASFNNLSGDQSVSFTGTPVQTPTPTPTPTPVPTPTPAPTFTIAGRVTDANNAGISSVSVTLTGSQSRSATTDSNGSYSFADLAAGGNYTVTVARTNFTFSPTSRSFNNLQSNQTASFAGALANLSARGRVTDANGNPIPDVDVVLSGAGSQATKTDAAGNYSFTTIVAGRTYIVTPSKDSYTFAPTNSVLSNFSSDNNALNFVGKFDPNAPPFNPNENFDGNQRDPTKFNLGTLTTGGAAFDPLVTVTQVNGTLQITPRAGVDDASFNGYVSVRGIDLTEVPTVGVEVVQPATGDGAQTIFGAGNDANTFYRFIVTSDPSDVANINGKNNLQTKDSSASTQALNFQSSLNGTKFATNIPYSPVAHRFWRLRFDATLPKIFFETSPDAKTWTAQFSSAIGKSVSSLVSELSAGTIKSSANVGTAIFDNYGVASPVGVQFAAPSYSIVENAGSATITVIRTGNTESPAAVDYSTSNGTATAGVDYTAVSGTLRFAAGETSKSFNVPIINDSIAEPDETVNLTLSNNVGTALGGTSNVTLTIIDDDNRATNPIDDARFFVRQQYLDFLNREPDTDGLNYWVQRITDCGSDAKCISNRRIDVSAAFFMSQEFQETGSFVYRFYKAAFGVRPTFAQFMADRARIIGGGNLEASKQSFANDFTNRPDFKSRYDNLTEAQYVDALYANAGVKPGSEERAALIVGLLTKRETRASVLRQVAANEDFIHKEFNPSFVLAEYFGYLRRDPDEAGYQFWLGILNDKVPGNYRAMVCAFITSAEYQFRFGSVRTRTDAECAQ